MEGPGGVEGVLRLVGRSGLWWIFGRFLVWFCGFAFLGKHVLVASHGQYSKVF